MYIRTFLWIVLSFSLLGCSSEQKSYDKSEICHLGSNIHTIVYREEGYTQDSLLVSFSKETNKPSSKENNWTEINLNKQKYMFSVITNHNVDYVLLYRKHPQRRQIRIARVALQDPYTNYRIEDVNQDGWDDLLFTTLYVRGNHYYFLFLYDTQNHTLVQIPELEDLSEPEYNSAKKWVQSSFYTRDGGLYKETWKWQGIKLSPLQKVELERAWDKKTEKFINYTLCTYKGFKNSFRKQYATTYMTEKEALNVFEKSLWDDSQ